MSKPPDKRDKAMMGDAEAALELGCSPCAVQHIMTSYGRKPAARERWWLRDVLAVGKTTKHKPPLGA